MTTPSTAVSYTSDARNLRQSRTVGGATRQFTWSSVGALPLLLDDGEHSYVYGASSTPLAQVDDTTGMVQYLHADLLGSPRLVTDSAGSQVGTVSFDAFGTVAARSGVQSSFGFTGNWADPDTGLLYLRARDYDPATGQFLSVDPLVNKTRQPYAYTGNSPVSRTDPTGLDPAEDLRDLAQGLVIAAVAGFVYPGAWDLLRSDDDEALVIGGYVLGVSGPSTTYGEGTGLVHDLKGMPETSIQRGEIIQQLHNGTYAGPLDAGYRAGSPGLANAQFRADLFTYATWGDADYRARVRAALGTYDLSVSVVCVDYSSGSALIEFEGSNQSTLGSAFGFNQTARDFLNAFAQVTGLGTAVEQRFIWQEEVRFGQG